MAPGVAALRRVQVTAHAAPRRRVTVRKVASRASFARGKPEKPAAATR
jgi:hypothetical protein